MQYPSKQIDIANCHQVQIHSSLVTNPVPSVLAISLCFVSKISVYN